MTTTNAFESGREKSGCSLDLCHAWNKREEVFILFQDFLKYNFFKRLNDVLQYCQDVYCTVGYSSFTNFCISLVSSATLGSSSMLKNEPILKLQIALELYKRVLYLSLCKLLQKSFKIPFIEISMLA